MDLTVRMDPAKTLRRQAPALLVGTAVGLAFGTIVLDLSPAATVALAVVALAVQWWVAIRSARRRPFLIVDARGIPFPNFGVELPWSDVADVRRADPAEWGTPVLLIVPTDPETVLRQARPACRAGLRHILGQVGTPLSVGERTLDHALDDIEAAIRTHRPHV